MLPHFKGWKQVPEGYFTRTRLEKELRRRPVDPKNPDGTVRASQNNKCTDLFLYHIDNTVEIKRRVVREIEETDQNIAEALYIINKSAKASRDSKVKNYENDRHQYVGFSKDRQVRLYSIKENMLKWLEEQGKVTTEGYHIQRKQVWNKYREEDDVKVSYLILKRFSGFSFHIPSSYQPKNLMALGEIVEVSAEINIKTSINFYEAEALLLRLCKENSIRVSTKNIFGLYDMEVPK